MERAFTETGDFVITGRMHYKIIQFSNGYYGWGFFNKTVFSVAPYEYMFIDDARKAVSKRESDLDKLGWVRQYCLPKG